MGSLVRRKFGDHLRWWRRRRGLSQLELAGVAGTSQRHLSFLESGRAAPSQQMVLSLAAALNVSLRQQNAFLGSAGYAPIWREGRLGEPELAQVDDALAHVLAQQEPYPAFVVDRHWNLRRANQAARPPGRVPARSGARRPGQPGGRSPLAGRPAAVRRELGGGRAPLHPRRAGRGHHRRLVQNRPRCWRASSPMKVCANCRARPPWRRHHGPCCRSTCSRPASRSISSRPSPPSARRRTSRSRKSGSRASSRSSGPTAGSSASPQRPSGGAAAADDGIVPATVLGTRHQRPPDRRVSIDTAGPRGPEERAWPPTSTST